MSDMLTPRPMKQSPFMYILVIIRKQDFENDWVTESGFRIF